MHKQPCLHWFVRIIQAHFLPFLIHLSSERPPIMDSDHGQDLLRDLEFEQAEAADSGHSDAQHELEGGDKFKGGGQHEEGEINTHIHYRLNSLNYYKNRIPLNYIKSRI